MSKNIWHTTDEAPKPYEDIAFYVDGYLYFASYEPQYNQYGIFGADKVEKWCYSKELSSYILALETENKDLSDKIGKLEAELDRTRKALSYAIGVIQTVAKMSDKLSREYGETLVEQLDNIQAYCWQEGDVLTHEEDLSKALTKGGNNE